MRVQSPLCPITVDMRSAAGGLKRQALAARYFDRQTSQLGTAQPPRRRALASFPEPELDDRWGSFVRRRAGGLGA